MTLPDAISDALPPDDRMRIGTVLTRFPTTVDIEGTAVPAAPVSSYFPIVGDTVVLLRQDASWLILGRTTSIVTGRYPQFQSGLLDVTVTAAASVVVQVNFPLLFRRPPTVHGNINAAPGTAAGWQPRCINITTTKFDLFMFGASSSFTVPVGWLAMEYTQ